MDSARQNPTAAKPRFAAALRYDPDGDAAPRVAAKGRGEVARRMLDVARQCGVPIHEDPDLAAALCNLDLDEAIPPALYRIVAEILAFLYRMNLLASKQESQHR